MIGGKPGLLWFKLTSHTGVRMKNSCAVEVWGAVRPATAEDFARVLPAVSLAAMGTFLVEFAATIPADTHVVLVLDQAGWRSSRRLCARPYHVGPAALVCAGVEPG